MCRTYQFLVKAGVNGNNIRFRQHLKKEMAHYVIFMCNIQAKDCWDAEIETSFGWVECVGHADRAAFDLCAHTKATKVFKIII